MRAENAAAVAALEAVWNAAQVHEPGAVPKSPVTPYAVVSVSSASTTNRRGGNSESGGSASHRVAVVAVGRDVSEVGFAVEKAEAAFLGRRLAVAGRRTTPCRSEVSSPIIRDPDGGVLLSVTLTYTFASSPA